MRIAVAGTGYVGLVAGVCFAEKGHDVICVDVEPDKVALLKSGVSPIYEDGLEPLMRKNRDAGRIEYTTDYKTAYASADAVFIGVATPPRLDGSADLGYIFTAAKQIAESVERECLVVIKSTVPVGTNDKIEQLIGECKRPGVHVEVASNPEFLAQGTAVRDTLEASRVVIGTESEWAKARLLEIYEPFALPIISVSRRSAEMIKYACNNFLALKISYMNDIANLCEAVGADVQDVARAMSYDKRIGSSFLNAGIGYGGSCFPKDTRALKFIAEQAGYRLETVEAAVRVNDSQKLRLFKKATARLGSLEGLSAAVLGLTFKPGTDDLREAPSVENIRLLLERGATIRAYDPVGMDNFRRLFPEAAPVGEESGEIRCFDTPEAALSGADMCFIFTEWKQIRSVEPCAYKKLMKTPLVFDGRNIYDVDMMRLAGVEYHGIGKPRQAGE